MSIKMRIGLGAAVAAFVPLLCAWLAASQFRSNFETIGELNERDRRAQNLTIRLERLTVDMETGIRGFALTGEPEFLEPYQNAVGKAGPVAGELSAILPDPRERALIERIRTGIEDYRFKWAEPRIRLLQAREPIPDSLGSGEGKKRMDALRRLFADLLDIEDARVGSGLARIARAQAQLSAIFWGAAGGLSLLLLAGSAALFRDLRRRSTALFEGLETLERGEYRPVVIAGDDEIGRIAKAFNRSAEESVRRDEELRRTAEEADAGNRELLAQQKTLIDSQRRILEAEARARNLADEADAARRELDRFFSISPDLFAIADFDGRFVKLNSAWESKLGYGRDELLARPFLDFVHPEDQNATAAEAAKLASGASTLSFENRYRRRDGRFVWLQWTSAPDLGRRLIYATARDITRRRELEKRLQRKAAEVAASNEELEAFSYSVSHDLRAPLRAIDGFSRVLLEDAADRLDDEGKDALDRIRGASQRMGLLIDDLLELSRVSKAKLEPENVDLGGLAREVLAALSSQSPGRAVETIVPERIPGRGDPRLLRIVLDNLLGNAWKFTAHATGARIELGSSRDGGDPVVYWVRDNGVGFDPAYADKLFTPFQRLHGTDEFPGTGIGLATVRRIIRRHGGKTWAEGSVGGGATFYFTTEGGAPE